MRWQGEGAAALDPRLEELAVAVVVATTLPEVAEAAPVVVAPEVAAETLVLPADVAAAVVVVAPTVGVAAEVAGFGVEVAAVVAALVAG